MRNLFLYSLFLLLSCATTAQANEPFSALYLHPDIFADPALSRQEAEALMDRTLDEICACGFTALLPYANTSSGKEHWQVKVEKVEEAARPDTLELLCAKARQRGLKIIPVYCVLVSGHDEPAGILKEHPHWALQKEEGTAIGWISPAHPEARQWIVERISELARHVDADGIMLDYLRFPNEPDVTLDTENLKNFMEAQGDAQADARSAALQEVKESATTLLMTEISESLRHQKKEIRRGIYSWGAHVTSGHNVAQPWPDWVAAGLLDLINISGYCYTDNYGDAYLDVFRKRLKEAALLAKNASASVDLSFALGVHTSHGTIADAREISRYLASARTLGYSGVAAFAWGGMKPFLNDIIEAGYFKLSHPLPSLDSSPVRFRMTVDFGADQGQNRGTLFEITDEEGHARIGAGFQGVWNTHYPGDRFSLQLWERPGPDGEAVSFQPLPRPSEGSLHYLFGTADGVHATCYTGDIPFKRWQNEKRQWEAAEGFSFQVGTHRYMAASNVIRLGEKEVFSFEPEKGTAGIYYYGGGHLFFQVRFPGEERKTALYACPWKAETGEVLSLDQARVQILTVPGEFPYAYGQLNGDVFVATNNGGVFRFSEGQWYLLRPADPQTSFQIYAMINYYDRLLMGQYPTGELFDIQGDRLVHWEGVPPRPENSSPLFREAQSLAIYRGELYAGIWPWGEVWRLPHREGNWHYAARLFTRPSVSADITAPYEKEMNERSAPVYNIWGQRVTSLVPFGNSLYASTASKNGACFDEEYDFLDSCAQEEYGAVYRLTLPGHAETNIPWTGAPVAFDIQITPEAMTLSADDKEVLQLSRGNNALPYGSRARLHWGQGIFGPLHGEILRAEVEME